MRRENINTFWKGRKMKKTILLVLVLVLGLATEVVNADFTFGTPTNLGPIINVSDDVFGVSISADGLSLYLASNRPGGHGHYDLWVATRPTIDDDWSAPMNLGPTVNSQYPCMAPSISADGLQLFFSDWEYGTMIPGGIGSTDTWMMTRENKEAAWSAPVNIGRPVNYTGGDICPTMSVDGLSLYFASGAARGGSGFYDLWVATRTTTDDDWGEPVNLGPIVNSSATDISPSLSADGLTLFFCRTFTGQDFDLWMTMRATKDDAWGPPVKLAAPVNTSDAESFPSISADGSTLYFCSDRAGGSGQNDIWQVPIVPIVDLNGDGIVDSADMCIIVDNWGTDESLCDIGPMPWGDGIVDVQDLIVLAEHLFEDYRLIAHWKLDEETGNTAYDSVSDNDGTLNGNPIWQPTGGQVAGSLQFDGIDDYVSTPFILNPAKGSLSAFAWVKGGARGQVIISQSDITIGRTTQLGNAWLWADSSYGRLITRLMHPPFAPLVSESVITDGQWHHVGLVYDFIGLYRYLYVDGAEVARDTDFVGGAGSDGGLYIGAGESLVPVSFWSGLIDDVRIYNHALNAEEIEALAR